MALTMLDKKPVQTQTAAWPPAIAAEFDREQKNPNGCVGQRLISENNRVRVWEIRLKPGERFGFHRHVLDYFWTAVMAGRARAHVSDGTTVEHTYLAGETRHETHEPGHFKVHDLDILLHLSGSETKIKTKYVVEWAAVAQWDPEARYNPIGSANRSTAALMIRSAETLLRVL